ncbi:MAG: type 1 glutamine amidotransferase [Ignavibacteria bacterium]|nr:type 1 glutamine amidotransferase [Ignavibacteria bacterium]
MKIAVSKASGNENYGKYEEWLKAADDSVEVVDLSTCASVEDAKEKLKECSGIVFSGGPDVHPSRYNMPELLELCTGLDEKRDELEFALVEEARELQMPVLGICRGAQLLNVAYGGTLYADIRTQVPEVQKHDRVDGYDSQHPIAVEPGSMIKRVCRVLDDVVNSAHHQSVKNIAGIFSPAAYSDDGIIEAFEWGDATMGGKPFLLAVQWHPERMSYSSAMSGPIAEHFVLEAQAYESLMKA